MMSGNRTGGVAFRAKHIPGSLHFDTEEAVLANLRKDDEVVVYCSNVACHASIALYHFLVDHGFTNVRRYDGGIADWEAAGLQVHFDVQSVSPGSVQIRHGSRPRSPRGFPRPCS